MNNRLLGTGIALALILALISITFIIKGGTKSRALPDFKSVKKLISDDRLDVAKEKMDKIAKENSGQGLLGKIYFDIAESYERRNETLKARDTYQLILNKYQNVENILEVQKKLGELNIKILFSSIVTDTDVLYEVEPGDTLSKIAKKFGTTVELIKTSNSLKSDLIRTHLKLKISTARYKILIDKSQDLLTLLCDDNKIVKVYRVSTGENNSTPLGTFKIINRIKDPVWYKEGAIVPSESPENILGSRWLGLSVKGYGIHGTTDPESVGRQVTKGCIRMLNSEVEELYTIIPIGTEVRIVD